MMEKKRSVGVIVVGTLTLIWGLLIISQRTMFLALWFYRMLSFLGLFIIIIGINVLMLKEWARKILIYLSAIICIPSILVLTFPIISEIGYICDSLTIGLGIKEIFKVIMYREGVEWLFAIVCVLGLFCTLPTLTIWIFFTRPKVKEQFKSS